MTDKLVSTDWVAEHGNDDGVRLVEVDVDTSAYGEGHIAGAVGWDWTTQLQDQMRRDIISKDDLEALLGASGIENDTQIVLYGDNNNWFAAYALWVLELYGHDNAALMDGGRVKWLAEERATTTDETSVAAASYTAQDPNPALRAERDEVLAAVGGEGKRPVEQGLDHEIRDYATVGRVHPGTVGIEDANDPDIDAVLAVVIEEQRFGATLAFVVAGARADGVHIAPVVFLLRVGKGVAVHLAGRGLEDARAAAPGKLQHVDRSMHRGLHGLHGVMLVMHRTRRAGEVENAIHFQAQRLRDVMADEFEIRFVKQMRDIRLGAGEQVVEADDIRAVGHQALAKV